MVGPYLDQPERALVLSVREKTQIRALGRTELDPQVQERNPERQTHDYGRNGTTDLFATREVQTSGIAEEYHQRHRAKEFVAFCWTLGRTTPSAFDLRLFLDNPATRKMAKVKRWVLRHPRFHFHIVPTSSS